MIAQHANDPDYFYKQLYKKDKDIKRDVGRAYKKPLKDAATTENEGVDPLTRRLR